MDSTRGVKFVLAGLFGLKHPSGPKRPTNRMTLSRPRGRHLIYVVVPGSRSEPVG